MSTTNNSPSSVLLKQNGDLLEWKRRFALEVGKSLTALTSSLVPDANGNCGYKEFTDLGVARPPQAHLGMDAAQRLLLSPVEQKRLRDYEYLSPPTVVNNAARTWQESSAIHIYEKRVEAVMADGKEYEVDKMKAVGLIRSSLDVSLVPSLEMIPGWGLACATGDFLALISMVEATLTSVGGNQAAKVQYANNVLQKSVQDDGVPIGIYHQQFNLHVSALRSLGVVYDETVLIGLYASSLNQIYKPVAMRWLRPEFTAQYPQTLMAAQNMMISADASLQVIALLNRPTVIKSAGSTGVYAATSAGKESGSEKGGVSVGYGTHLIDGVLYNTPPRVDNWKSMSKPERVRHHRLSWIKANPGKESAYRPPSYFGKVAMANLAHVEYDD